MLHKRCTMMWNKFRFSQLPVYSNILRMRQQSTADPEDNSSDKSIAFLSTDKVTLFPSRQCEAGRITFPVHKHNERRKEDAYEITTMGTRKIYGGKNDKNHKKVDYRLPGVGKRERPSTTSYADDKSDILFGIFPILFALKTHRRTPHKLFMKSGLLKSPSNDNIRSILTLSEFHNVEVESCSGTMLDNISGNRPHQGVCLQCDKLIYDKTNPDLLKLELTPESKHLWLYLDCVQDPMNFGAILRSSYFFGVDKILTPPSNSCALSPVVSKASAGCMELLNLSSIDNPEKLFIFLKSFGFTVLGASSNKSDTQKVFEVKDAPLQSKTVLVIGNEGQGISPDIAGLCDAFITISPQCHGHLDSLNVSVATGVLLYHLALMKGQITEVMSPL